MSASWKYWTTDSSGVDIEHDWSNADDPLPSGALLFKVEFLNQFYEMCYELSLLVSYDLFATSAIVDYPPISSGIDTTHVSASGYTTIATLQNVIELLMLRTHPDYGTEYVFVDSTSDVLGLSASIYKTGNELLVASGLPAYSADYATALEEGCFKPRRTRVHPSDADFSGYEYGYIRAGDIIGPWIFEDMRRLGSRINYLLVSLDYALRGFYRPPTQAKQRSASNPTLWSSASWSDAGANGYTPSGNYTGGFGGWSMSARIDRFGLDFSFGATLGYQAWRDRQLSWSLLAYPDRTSSTLASWTLGVPYGLYSQVNSGVINNWQAIDMGHIFDLGVITPPYDGAPPSSLVNGFGNLASPEVMAQKTIHTILSGASVLLSIARI